MRVTSVLPESGLKGACTFLPFFKNETECCGWITKPYLTHSLPFICLFFVIQVYLLCFHSIIIK